MSCADQFANGEAHTMPLRSLYRGVKGQEPTVRRATSGEASSMSQQLGLFQTKAVGAHRKAGPTSSIEAARTCDASRQRDLLARELSGALDGLTCSELESLTGIPAYIVASRLAQMRRDMVCEPFGQRRNARGRLEQIWFTRTAPRSVDVVDRQERI